MKGIDLIRRRIEQALTHLSKHSETQAQVSQLLSEATLHSSATWAAHMTPDINDSALLGKVIAGLHNGNLLSADLYPKLAGIEAELINRLCRLFQQKNGHFTHGSSYGNLEALWQAREQAQSTSNIVYASHAAHYSIAKACRILGLEFRPIRCNDNGEIDTAELLTSCQQNPPVAIVATAGSSACGAIDSLTKCIEIAHQYNSWCHVDAAWGGVLALIEDDTHLAGIDKADSICFDPHKALGLAKPSSLFMYQHELESFTDLEADYLTITPNKTVSGSYGGELFLPLWLSLELDKTNLTNQIKQRLTQAELFAETLKQETNWKVWHSPTGIVCFKPNNYQSLKALEQKGVFSQAKINQQDVYRAVFSNASTQADRLIMALKPYF